MKLNFPIYNILTNKAAKGRKGAITAIVARTKAETVIAIIEKNPLKQRNMVKEITFDMAGNMGLIGIKPKSCGEILKSRFLYFKITQKCKILLESFSSYYYPR